MTESKTSIISANDLLDGDVVYLDAHGGWTRELCKSSLITSEEQAAEFLKQAKAQPGRIIDPYLLEVTVLLDRITPVHIRERLRASGPSIHFGQLRAKWQQSD